MMMYNSLELIHYGNHNNDNDESRSNSVFSISSNDNRGNNINSEQPQINKKTKCE